MSYKPWSLLACAAAGLIHTVAQPARALSCEAPGVSAPAWESTDVPTNTLVWCTTWNNADPSELRVTDPQGLTVTGTQTTIASHRYTLTLFRPDAELAPNTRYEVSCGLTGGGQPGPFTTGAGPRAEPPALPDLEHMQLQGLHDTGWGESIFARFDSVSAKDTIVVLDLEGGPEMNAAGLTGNVDDASLMRGDDGSLFVGSGPCIGNWSEAKPGATTRLRLGAFDLTGAFSGWSDWRTVTLPELAEVEGQQEQDPPPDLQPSPEPTPEELAENETEGAGPTVASDDAPAHDVIRTDLASDSIATPSRQSSGCQLGAPGGTWSVAGLLAALALIATRRQRRSRTGA